MSRYFRRIYKLTIGDYNKGQGILLQDHELQFDIVRTSDNKKGGNTATFSVYNLSKEDRTRLQSKFLEIAFEVGYVETDLTMLVKGNVTSVRTARNGVDIVTQLVVGEGYTSINHSKISTKVPAGKTKKDVAEEIIKSIPNANVGVLSGANLNSRIVQGYILEGTGKEVLDDFTKRNDLEWRYQNGTIDIADKDNIPNNYKDIAVVFSPYTGLLDSPYFTDVDQREQGDSADTASTKDKKKSTGAVQFKALLNTHVVCGNIVYLDDDSTEVPVGYYKVTEVRYSGDFRGNDWCIECICNRVKDEIYE